MSHQPFELHLPASRTTCVVFASPHSGRAYPWDFLRHTVLDERAIRSSEDAFVDRLFDCAPEFGAPLLAATAPRAYVDLNRGADELDPALVRDVRLTGHNPRISSGLGVIPRVVANGREIYRGKIELAEARRRLAEVWRPYHAELQHQLDDNIVRFGRAILIDCHSMPHEAIDSLPGRPGLKPEVVLGDRFGTACAPEVIDRIEAAFAGAGLRVVRNAPFAGAYITQHYGRPARRQHVVQVEIDRGLYMNEQAIRPNADFGAIRALLREVVAELTAIGRPSTLPVAAE